jgi:TIR domain
MATKFYLPSKISSYLKRLLAEYKLNGDSKYAEIISCSKFLVQEGVDYDNWDGGQYGHVIKFFLTTEQLTSLVPLKTQDKIAEKFHSDINQCAQAISGEYISKVRFEVDDNDVESQNASHLSEKPFISPDSLSIWRLGCIRLFISHRDKYKSQANELAELLSNYGISSFVAHDSIEPMEQWQQTILKGLETMELMLTFVTDDFHESYWTNQEIGYALARNIPVISLKLENKDPVGFIAEKQALKGNIEDLTLLLPKLYELLAKKLSNQSRMQTALIEAFVTSPEWSETTRRFDRLSKHVTKLSDSEVERIISAYRNNDQLHTAVYLTNKDRLKKFLNSVSSDDCTIEGNIITLNNDIPF